MNEYKKSLIELTYMKNDFIGIFNNIPQDNSYIITDENVYKYHSDLIDKIPHTKIIKLIPGEITKNPNTILNIITSMIKSNIGKDGIIINIGGGVVTDIGGFVASIYKRGINFINVPTTVLGMVDAAIGGKNGTDFIQYKNIIGTFYFPLKIIIYPPFIDSLDTREIHSGIAEYIKTSLIFPDKINKVFSSIDITSDDIYECAINKLNLVDEDPDESLGKRKWLNIGHTIGHAVESYYMNDIKHGEAVIIGILIESLLSEYFYGKKEWMNDLKEFILIYYEDVIRKYPIPPIKNLKNYLIHDKKNKNNKISFSLVKNLGEIEIKEIDIQTIENVIYKS